MSDLDNKIEKITVFVKENGVPVPNTTLDRLGKLVAVYGIATGKLAALILPPKQARFISSVMDMIDEIDDPTRNVKALLVRALNGIRKY